MPSSGFDVVGLVVVLVFYVLTSAILKHVRRIPKEHGTALAVSVSLALGLGHYLYRSGHMKSWLMVTIAVLVVIYSYFAGYEVEKKAAEKEPKGR